MQRNGNSYPSCRAASASPGTGGQTRIDKHFPLTMFIADIFIMYELSDRLQQSESCLVVLPSRC